MEECHTEASIGIDYSESAHTSSLGNGANLSLKTVGQVEGCSPSEKRKRKRISPHATPKVAEGRSKSDELFVEKNKGT